MVRSTSGARSCRRRVSVNASATLQMISASVLDGFVKVYEGYEKLGGEPVSPEHINSGEPLGTFSFTAQTQ